MEEPGTDGAGAESEHHRTGPTQRRYGKQALIALLILTLLGTLVTLGPLAAPVFLGALLAAFAAPACDRLSARLGRRGAAALITFVILIAILAPLTIILGLVVDRLTELVSSGSMQGLVERGGGVDRFVQQHPSVRRFFPADLGVQVTSALKWFGNALPSLLGGIANSTIGLFIAVLTVYFVLRDARSLAPRVERALPLEPRHTRAIFHEFESVGRAVIIGTLGTALIQGVIAGIIYWALGLAEPLLLGALTAIISVIPVGGSGLVWAPLSLYLMATGETTRGLVLIGLGFLVVGTVDNFVRPLLTKGGLSIHPLLIFLAIFGGLAAFGVSGLYLGPLFVALFMAVVHIYERELAPAGLTPANQDLVVPPPAEDLSGNDSRLAGR
jgi:predicted PurR-regulated permease PerM